MPSVNHTTKIDGGNNTKIYRFLTREIEFSFTFQRQNASRRRVRERKRTHTGKRRSTKLTSPSEKKRNS